VQNVPEQARNPPHVSSAVLACRRARADGGEPTLRIAKPLRGKLRRRFESLPLRHLILVEGVEHTLSASRPASQPDCLHSAAPCLSAGAGRSRAGSACRWCPFWRSAHVALRSDPGTEARGYQGCTRHRGTGLPGVNPAQRHGATRSNPGTVTQGSSAHYGSLVCEMYTSKPNKGRSHVESTRTVPIRRSRPTSKSCNASFAG
jgi:hypothetical protein